MGHWIHTFFLETKTPTNLDIIVVIVEKVGESHMVRTIPNSERVFVQYKFQDEDVVLVKMMTLDEYQNQKKLTT